MTDKPDCLVGEAHHWIFQEVTGSAELFGPRHARGTIYDATKIRIKYRKLATCQKCEQTYDFGGTKEENKAIKKKHREALWRNKARKYTINGNTILNRRRC